MKLPSNDDYNQDEDQVWFGWTIRKSRVGGGAKLAHQSHSQTRTLRCISKYENPRKFKTIWFQSTFQCFYPLGDYLSFQNLLFSFFQDRLLCHHQRPLRLTWHHCPPPKHLKQFQNDPKYIFPLPKLIFLAAKYIFIPLRQNIWNNFKTTQNIFSHCQN